MKIVKDIAGIPSDFFFSKTLTGCRKREEIPAIKGFTKLKFTSGDGIVLRGWLYRKPGIKKIRGTCFLLHGYSSNSESCIDDAKRISNNHSLAVISYDHRHHGLSDDGIPTFGSAEAFDLQAAMDYAETKNLPTPFILHGTSLGGMAAQRAAINDEHGDGTRVNGLFLRGVPAWPMDAIGVNSKVDLFTLGAAGAITSAYNWNILNDGDIRNHTQLPGYCPYVCYIMGTEDHYGIAKTKKIYDYWHKDKNNIGAINKFPSECKKNIRKWFWEIKGAVHPSGPENYQVWDWDGYGRLEYEFIERVLVNN